MNVITSQHLDLPTGWLANIRRCSDVLSKIYCIFAPIILQDFTNMDSATIVYIVIEVLIAVLAVIGNSLVCYVVIKSKKLREKVGNF